MTPDELIGRWRSDAEVLERHGDSRGAGMLRAHAAELGEVLRAWRDETLDLRQAGLESSYSYDHLRHRVADGSIPNAGRPGAPRIRRSDLPLKAGHDPDALGVDATEVAEQILGGRAG